MDLRNNVGDALARKESRKIPARTGSGTSGMDSDPTALSSVSLLSCVGAGNLTRSRTGRVVRIPDSQSGCAKWVERRLNPRLRIFSPPLIRLSYRPMIGEDSPGNGVRTKKARCRGGTGLWRFSPNTAKRQKRRIWVKSAVSFWKTGRRIGITPCTQGFAYET